MDSAASRRPRYTASAAPATPLALTRSPRSVAGERGPMTDHRAGSASEDVAGRVRRVVGATVAAGLTATACASILPGSTILLGLLSADALLAALRAVGAIALVWALTRRDARRLAASLHTVGAGLVGLGILTALDPHLGGALAQGVAPHESLLTVAVGAVCLTTARKDLT